MTGHVPSRQRIRAALDHREGDRIPMIETFFWPATLERWRREGMPADATPTSYFGLDRLENFFGVFDCTPQLAPRTLEQDTQYRVFVNRYGAVVKAPRDGSQEPAMIEPAIRDRGDWQRICDRLGPDSARIAGDEVFERARQCRAAGGFVTIETVEPFWFVLHNTMGYEGGLLAMVEDPQLVEDMIATYTEFSIRMLGQCFERGFVADALWFFSDLCYRSGPMFSPQLFGDLGLPHLRRFTEFCREHDLYFWWHCDGNVAKLLPLLIELGVDAVHPLEARAQNDVRRYKRQFGDSTCLIGNINADVVAAGDRSAIEDEVGSKVTVAKRGGGYIYHIDHSVPPTVSLDSYTYLLEMVRKYGGYESRNS